MKTKLIHSEYFPETGFSSAAIHNRYGTFYGTAQLHPEDKENASNFVGCRYAEARAYINYNRHRLEIVNYQLKGLEDFEKTLKGKWNYDENSMECKQLRKRIYELKAERKRFKSLIESMKQALKKSMNERDTFLEKIEKKKNNA